MARVDVAILALAWLLQVASILVTAALRLVSRVAEVLVAHLALLDSDLARDETSRRVLNVILQVVFRLILSVFGTKVDGSHAGDGLAHLAHGADLVDGATVLVQAVLVVRAHRGAGFGGLATANLTRV